MGRHPFIKLNDKFYSGQKGTKLFMEYIVVAYTIEEIDLVKLELSNNFYRGHIVPLANYYDKYC